MTCALCYGCHPTAGVIISKYADHLPLYSHSQIYALLVPPQDIVKALHGRDTSPSPCSRTGARPRTGISGCSLAITAHGTGPNYQAWFSPMCWGVKYIAKCWEGLILFLTDGRIEMDSNTVERTISPITLQRNNALFAGRDAGAQNWAMLASLIETRKLNKI